MAISGHCGCSASTATGGLICYSSIMQTTFKYIIGPTIAAFAALKTLSIEFITDFMGVRTYSNDQNNVIKVTEQFHEGTPASEHFVMPENGGYIFGKGGVDIFDANLGADNFFFSMCSAKNGTTINNFDDAKDKVYIFCTMKEVEASDIKVNFEAEKNVTNILVAGKFEPVEITLTGEHPNLMDNIVLNHRYNDVVDQIQQEQAVTGEVQHEQ